LVQPSPAKLSTIEAVASSSSMISAARWLAPPVATWTIWIVSLAESRPRESDQPVEPARRPSACLAASALAAPMRTGPGFERLES